MVEVEGHSYAEAAGVLGVTEEAARTRVAADAYSDVRRSQAERDAEALVEVAKVEAARILAEAQATAGAMIAAAVMDDRAELRVRSGATADPTGEVPSGEVPNDEEPPAATETYPVQVVVLPAPDVAPDPKPRRGRFGG